MEAYREATQPLSEFYAERKMLISISAKGKPNEVLQRTLNQLGEQLSIAVA